MNLIEITSLEQPGPERFIHATETQLRGGEGGGSFIAESPNVILRALEAGLEPLEILCEKGFAEAALRGDASSSGDCQANSAANSATNPAANSPAGEIFRRAGDIPIYVGSPELLSRITGYSLLRGVSCEFRRPALRTAEEVCKTASSASRIAVTVGVVDAANIGAIFRSAAALGIDAILLSPDCCDPLNRRTVRTSMGTVFQIPWAWLEGPDTVEELHRLGFKTAAMALRDGALAPDSPELRDIEKLAIILGNEGNGLPQALIDASDYVVCIPMSHGVDSLNVAIAGAVAFYVLRKK